MRQIDYLIEIILFFANANPPEKNIDPRGNECFKIQLMRLKFIPGRYGEDEVSWGN